ncbi:MAG: class I SAM-dependent methyltransferase [Bacteroidia bacterium]|jgi:SAM-dependent methyltransferase|nr:class I SAM-dependent methyltransferase [Bacteroidia bacterium]
MDFLQKIKKQISPIRRFVYKINGRIPWSYGYPDSRWHETISALNSSETIDAFRKRQIKKGFGIGFDERIVEYPWIFSNLRNTKNAFILDAGSTFNFQPIVEHKALKESNLMIYTYFPESDNFIKNRVSYVFGDLRDLPFKSELFDEIVCQSTLEHVDMDNSIYGYQIPNNDSPEIKSYEFLKVIEELIRVLKPGGQLMLTFPYGRFEHHGFFQQFDKEMTDRITQQISVYGKWNSDFIIYSKEGWSFQSQENCNDSFSFNPHTGKGKGTDGAAHCRCVCCIKFVKDR